jgi:hypothetical protein
MTATRIGINGFGRMGRLALRAAWAWPEFEFAHINELGGDAATSAHLLTFDSVHGRWDGGVECEDDAEAEQADDDDRYMANAAGRLFGTVLSGALYVLGGLELCLWASAGFVVAEAVLSRLLPAAAGSPALEPAGAITA